MFASVFRSHHAGHLDRPQLVGSRALHAVEDRTDVTSLTDSGGEKRRHSRNSTRPNDDLTLDTDAQEPRHGTARPFPPRRGANSAHARSIGPQSCLHTGASCAAGIEAGQYPQRSQARAEIGFKGLRAGNRDRVQACSPCLRRGGGTHAKPHNRSQRPVLEQIADGILCPAQHDSAIPVAVG